MRYVFLIIGLLLTLGAMVNTSLFYAGLVIMALSFVFSSNNEKSITKIEQRKSLFDKLDAIKISVPDDAISSIVQDAVAVTTKIAKGGEANLGSKEIVKGTLNTIDGMSKVFK